MADNARTIPPALTTPEWDAGYIEFDSESHLTMNNACTGVELVTWKHVTLDGVRSELGGKYEVSFPSDLAKLFAFANDALPDDSPYKITRRMVDSLRELLDHPDPRRIDNGAIETLHVALAALLRPE